MNRTRYHISLTVVRILAVLSLGGCCACSADTADAASAGAVRSMVCVGGEGLADGREIAILDDGGFVVAGSFNGQVVFGPGEADETALTAISEADDVFIARYRPDGTLAWVKWVFGEGKESVSGLAVKKDGSILVTGGFGSFNNPAGTIAVFGYGEANETVLAILDSPEIFVAEYGADGGLLWASQSHGKRGKASLAISEGKGGTALVTGGFRGVMTLGSGDPKETRLATYTYTSNLFVAGYESQGALAWAFDLGSLESESGRDIHGFQDGSFLLTGIYSNRTDFDPSGDGFVLDAIDDYDVFFARYNADRTLAWIRTAGGEHSEGPWDLSVGSDGGFAVTGTFSKASNRDWNSFTLGPGEANETTLESDDPCDAFMARFGPDGSLLWAEGAISLVDADLYGTTSHGKGLALLDDGSVVVTGEFSAAVALDWQGENEITLYSSAEDDIELFVARYGPDGSLDWAKRAGGEASDRGNAVALRADGSLLLTGRILPGSTYGDEENKEDLVCTRGDQPLVLNIDP